MAGDSGHEPLDVFVHGRLSLNPDLDVNSLQTAFAFNVCVCVLLVLMIFQDVESF